MNRPGAYAQNGQSVVRRSLRQNRDLMSLDPSSATTSIMTEPASDGLPIADPVQQPNDAFPQARVDAPNPPGIAIPEEASLDSNSASSSDASEPSNAPSAISAVLAPRDPQAPRVDLEEQVNNRHPANNPPGMDLPEAVVINPVVNHPRGLSMRWIAIVVLSTIALAATVSAGIALASDSGGGNSSSDPIIPAETTNEPSMVPATSPEASNVPSDPDVITPSTLMPTRFPSTSPTTPIPTLDPTTSPSLQPTSDPTPVPTPIPTPGPTPFPTTTTPLPASPFWKPMGELAGKAFGDRIGHAVSMSRDANTIAVAAPQTDGLGYVAVYHLDTVTQTWVPKGEDLVGDTVPDRFGWSVALNGNGNILAVGARGSGLDTGHVCVYEFDNLSSRWVPLGNVLVGIQTGDEFGEAVSLSESGDILAVGAWENDRGGPGTVRIYQLNRPASSWQQMGRALVGSQDASRFGSTVSLSNSGLVVAVGAHKHGAGAEGQVTVYRYSLASSSWFQMGGPMRGDADGERFGFSVSLSDDGLTVGVGSRWGKREQRGSASAYDYDTSSSAWTRRGQVLEGRAPQDLFGYSVSLNPNGNKFAVGTRWSDVNGNRTGHVTVFDYNFDDRSWNQVGSDLNGQDPHEEFGKAVSLGGTLATVLAVGGPFWKNETGHVNVYALN